MAVRTRYLTVNGYILVPGKVTGERGDGMSYICPVCGYRLWTWWVSRAVGIIARPAEDIPICPNDATPLRLAEAS